MRVANKSIFEAVKYQLANITEEMSNANLVVATGKRVNKLSDDPVGITQGLTIKTALANIEQLERNISLGNSWLTASESAMNQAQGIVSDLKALSVQMASATTDDAQRTSAAQTVQNMRDEIVALANTEVGGRYIFGGTKTDTIPFSQDGTYNGNSDAFTIKSDKNATMAVGIDGSTVFEDLFITLNSFEDALTGGNISGIQNAMDDLDTGFETITNEISAVGSKMMRMEVRGKILEDINLSNTERLSKIEDADIAEAIMNLKSVEFAYQATLAASSKVMGLSLVDYMR